MAMVDLYKALKAEVFRIFLEERERRKKGIRLRLEVQKKTFDKDKSLH
ncbi:MAG: hypothetical protein N3D14_00370 [Aquificaceae bacterium]|nr:hypothetical protein [Aquificaceae bacterium]MCX8163833.1 hypothetical protein [Aquificaceae bacterium]